MVVSVAPCRRDGSYLWLPLILVGKQTCLQTKKKEKCRLLCFFKPVCLGFCFVVQVLQFWGRKVCLFSLCVYVCGFASFKKIVCGFLNVASFFFVLLISQHVNHIAYWAECKPLSQKEKLHRPKPQISVVYRTSKSVSVWPPQFVLKRLSPAFRCTCVIDRFLASQRLEMVMDDQSGRRSPPRPQATVHSNRPNTSTHTHPSSGVNIKLPRRHDPLMHSGALGRGDNTDASLSQQHITSTLLTFTHYVYFRLNYFLLDIRRHKRLFFHCINHNFKPFFFSF